MNKILISVEKDCISFSKYNRNVSEENLNNTNVIDVKSLKFTEEYIIENLELVTTFVNLIVLKFKLNKAIVKNVEIGETTLKLLKNISNVKSINFKDDKDLSYTISSLLIENKNLEKIECYSLPNIMFLKFSKDQIKTRSKILSTSNFLEYNNIKTYSDLFNKDKIIISEYLTDKDINPLVYFLENNKNLKKIEFRKYNRKNLMAVLFYLNKNSLRKVNVIIEEEETTTKEIFEDIKLFDELNKKYNVNIKVKYSKEYKDKNKVKELNIVLLRTILTFCIIFALVLLFYFRFLEKKDSKAITQINDKINDIIVPETMEDVNGEIIEELPSAYYKDYSKVYDELVKLNSDTVGWLTVNNTKINYAVVQTKDNDYYLKHAYDHSINIAGWVYVDYRNNLDVIDRNTIIYGHSMLLDGVMFTTLERALNKNWYTNVNNQNIYFSIKGKDYTWRIFSIYTIETTSDYLYTDFNTDKEYLNFIDKLKKRSIYDFNVDVNDNDKILTLSSCYKDDKHRIVIHAKMN